MNSPFTISSFTLTVMMLANAPAFGQVVEWHGEGGLNWYEVSDDFHRENPLGFVSADDILEVIEHWGEYCPPGCTLDRNNDQRIDVSDLLDVMSGIPGPVYTIPDGWHIEDGCILRPPDDPLAGAFNSARWPDGIVYFEYDANVSGVNRLRFVAAINRWQEAANLTFVLRTDEPNWIHVQNATFNNSTSIGMQGGQQFINLSNWGTFTVEHEIAHALGFYHEHTRADRNAFVTINNGNICSCCGGSGTADCTGNFNIHGNAGPFGSTDYGPYDFDSMMHYSACAFDNCAAGVCTPTNAACRTITVDPPFDTQWQAAIGQRDHLSDMDIISMSMLYPEDNWEFVDDSWGGLEFGTFFEPHDTVTEGVAAVPINGTVIIQPGVYTEPGVIDKDLLLRAPIGGVLIQ